MDDHEADRDTSGHEIRHDRAGTNQLWWPSLTGYNWDVDFLAALTGAVR